jgi:hypothetical protein
LIPLSALAIFWDFGGGQAAAEIPKNELKQSCNRGYLETKKSRRDDLIEYRMKSYLHKTNYQQKRVLTHLNKKELIKLASAKT